MSSKKGKYWSGSHTTHRLLYHLVWIPKYRKRILKGQIVPLLRELFEEACQVNHWNLEELNIMDDHIHLLIQVHPRESISRVVQLLKGGSSRILRKTFEGFEEFTWGDSFWADGYFAETVGQTNEAVIRRYIKQQRQASFLFSP